MIRKSADKKIILKEKNLGGEGVTKVICIANEPAELNDKGRLYAHQVLEPGHSIGYHVHQKDSEIYYILRGTAEYNDNGVVSTISDGDLTFTAPGEGHSIVNIGDEPLHFIALILYE